MTGLNVENNPAMSAADFVIIGAGPAGMAAVDAAGEYGASIVLLDEQPSLGGQIYRNVERVARERKADLDLLGSDYGAGLALVQSAQRNAFHHIPGAMVWNIETSPSRVFYTTKTGTAVISAKVIVIATGAMERGLPIPGWTLPGVMGAGAAQVMLKSCSMIPEKPTVIAGSGPLLLLVADQLSKADCNIQGVIETTTLGDYFRAAPFLPNALRAPEYLKKGVSLRRSLRKQNVPVFSGAKNLRVIGETRVEGVEFRCNGKEKYLEAGVCLLHEGVVPNTQLTRQIGVDHEWYSRQDYWRPVLSKTGESSHKRVYVAGDGGGIDGAVVAAASGRVAALDGLFQIGHISKQTRDQSSAAAHAKKKRHARVRPLLDNLFAPPRYAFKKMQSDTIVCRCSEVTAGDISSAVAAGCHTPDQVKSSCRSGMGPCQGRMCGLSVSALIARQLGQSVADTGYYNIRSPIKPLTLAELARLEEQALSVTSV